MNKSNTFVVLFIAIVGSGAVWFLFGSSQEEQPKPQSAPVSNESAVDELPETPAGPAATVSVVKRPVIDGAKLVMVLRNWKSRGTPTRMIPWEGENLVFLTMEDRPVDENVVEAYAAKLDEGWSIYDALIPGSPPLRKQFNDKPTMIATPGIYACGLGCGYVGSTGIEVTSFYRKDYQAFIDHPDSFRHYYFYEMGRNWFLFGDGRYGMFKSSFAVHMRHVCMSRLKLNYLPGDLTRDDMLAIADKYRRSTDVDYHEHFADNDGFALKQVLKDRNADRNTVYAGIMLRLEDALGADFLPRFYEALLQCPGQFDHQRRRGAEGQTRNWIAACSYAAGKDLSGMFAERYHVPLKSAERQRFQSVAWDEDDAVTKFFATSETD